MITATATATVIFLVQFCPRGGGGGGVVKHQPMKQSEITTPGIKCPTPFNMCVGVSVPS